MTAAATRKKKLTHKTLVTDERINSFIERLRARGKRDIAGIRALCLGERNFLKSSKFIPRGVALTDENKKTLALTSRARLITHYRNAIRTKLGEDHPALRYMVLSEVEQDKRNASGRETVVARHNERRAIDGEKHVNAAIEILRNEAANAPLVVAAALIAVTGRRPVEILLTGNFKGASKAFMTGELFDGTIHAKRRWCLRFSGQAKTRGAENANAAPYDVPVLAPPDLILEAFAALRRRYDCKDLTPIQVRDRTSKELNRYARRHFTDAIGEQLNPSQLRAAYATIAYEWFAPEEQSWNAYTAKILGHSLGDLVTSFSYDQFYPTGSKRNYDRHVRAATRETMHALEVQRAEESDPTKAGYLDEKIATLRERLEAEAKS